MTPSRPRCYEPASRAELVAPLFIEVLERYYGGVADAATDSMLR